MAYLNLLSRHPRLLAFGVLLTLFSSFGQTFLISVFVPYMLEAFSLDKARFGSLYALATLASAASLPFFGRLLDRMPLLTFTTMASLGLAASCGVVAAAHHIPLLFLGLIGLRLNGQGLLTLTASTTMARAFSEFRGRALSISGIGFAVGESALPLAVLPLIGLFGWRLSWVIIMLLIVLLPALSALLLRGSPHLERTASTDVSLNLPGMTHGLLLRDIRFYLLLPGTLAIPFILTGVFLYQTSLAEFKGWSPAVMAGGFAGFAIMRLVTLLFGGPLIDRFSALRLLPFSLLPLAAGLACLWGSDHIVAAYLFFLLAGASQGVSGSILTAVWVDLYGCDALGQVKSLTAMLTVFGTAVSPALIGFLLTHHVTFGQILPALAALCLISAAISTLVYGLTRLSPQPSVRF